MKKTLIYIIMATFLIIITPSVNADADNLTFMTGLIAYWTHDEGNGVGLLGNVGTFEGTTAQTNTSCPFSMPSCIINSDDGVNNRFATNVTITEGNSYTFNQLINFNTDQQQFVFGGWDGGDYWYLMIRDTTNIGKFFEAGTWEQQVHGNWDYRAGSDTMVTMVIMANGTGRFYYNSTLMTDVTDSFDGANNFALDYFNLDGFDRNGDGLIAHPSVWNRALNQSEITRLWDDGNIMTYDQFTNGTPPAAVNLSINATDLYNSSGLSLLTAHITGVGTFYTSTGVITTNISEDDTTEYIIRVSSNQSGGYFNATYLSYNASLSGFNLSAEMFQAEVQLEAYEKVTGNQIYGMFNTSIRENATVFYITAGLHNITFFNSSYFNITEEFNITPLSNGTINISGVYNSLVNITFFNAFTGNNVSNFSGWAYNSTYNFNETFNATGEIAYINLTQNVTYLFFVEHFNYSTSSANYQNVTVDNASENVNYSLYTNNSINIFVYDETTNQLINTETITIVLSGALGDDTYNTSNGTLFVENLQDGNYSVRLSGGNYSLRTYSVTVAEKSTQTLNAYLSPNTVTVTLTFTDFDTAATLEGVGVSMSRLINGTWTIIESKTSDITGRSQFTYTPNVRYRFTATLTGYINRVFEFDPIIFSSYTVRMTRIVSYDEEQDYSSIGINYFPTIFYNNQVQNFTFTIQSPTGTLQSYGVNLTYPGGSTGGTGVNSQGETFTLTLNITGAGFLDKVNITYYYDTTIGEQRTYSIAYGIVGTDVDNATWLMLQDETFGLGDLERVFIAVLIIIIVAGMITLITANPLIGGGVGLLMLGLLAYIGFMPLWAALISFLVGLFIMFRAAGGS
jgi:hypothetical protein